jgi:hypothetical protein
MLGNFLVASRLAPTQEELKSVSLLVSVSELTSDSIVKCEGAKFLTNLGINYWALYILKQPNTMSKVIGICIVAHDREKHFDLAGINYLFILYLTTLSAARTL